MKATIYKVTNRAVKNRIYIGHTVNPLKTRLSNLLHSPPSLGLKNDIQKYGIIAFDIEPISIVNHNKAIQEEAFYIKTMRPFYNKKKPHGTRKPLSGRRVLIFRVDERLHKKLKNYCVIRGSHMSQVATEAVKIYLEDHKQDPFYLDGKRIAKIRRERLATS